MRFYCIKTRVFSKILFHSNVKNGFQSFLLHDYVLISIEHLLKYNVKIVPWLFLFLFCYRHTGYVILSALWISSSKRRTATTQTRSFIAHFYIYREFVCLLLSVLARLFLYVLVCFCFQTEIMCCFCYYYLVFNLKKKIVFVSISFDKIL